MWSPPTWCTSTAMTDHATSEQHDPRPWLLDANVLVALVLTTHVHHRAAHTALRSCEVFATTPVTEAALVRLLLNPAVTGSRFGATDALRVLRGLRHDPRHRSLPDDTTLTESYVDLSVLMGHRQVTDLHLLNLAARHACVLATFDGSLAQSVAPSDRMHLHLLPQ